MNKKEAVAYGQIALEMILHSTYKKEINLQNFSMEMRQAFKMYPKNIVLNIAEAKIFAEKNAIKDGCDLHE
jgi:hypothetical protein